jgi:hypothetical protein
MVRKFNRYSVVKFIVIITNFFRNSGSVDRQIGKAVSDWLRDTILKQQGYDSASLSEIHVNLDFLGIDTGTASRLVSYKDTYKLQTPLSQAVRSIDLAARYSVQNAVEWETITLATVAVAKELAARCYHAITNAGELWHSPHISSDAEGGVSFEWWNAHRSLSLFAHPDSTTSYLIAWGPDIWAEMETGDQPDSAQLLALWQRLNESE